MHLHGEKDTAIIQGLKAEVASEESPQVRRAKAALRPVELVCWTVESFLPFLSLTLISFLEPNSHACTIPGCVSSYVNSRGHTSERGNTPHTAQRTHTLPTAQRHIHAHSLTYHISTTTHIYPHKGTLFLTHSYMHTLEHTPNNTHSHTHTRTH